MLPALSGYGTPSISKKASTLTDQVTPAAERECKLRAARIKIEQIHKSLNSGSLNKEPLPFETTLKMIRTARSEQLEALQNPHEYARMRLLRNLSPGERKTVASLDPQKRSKAAELAQKLRNGHWKDRIFSDPQFGQYTFHVFNEKQITIDQLATVFLRWGAEKQFSYKRNPLKVHPIFTREKQLF